MYLQEHGIPYREIKNSGDLQIGEQSNIIVIVHQEKIVSQRMIATHRGQTIYRLVNVWNSRSLDWKYYVKEG